MKPFAFVCSPFTNDPKQEKEYCRKLYEYGYLPVSANFLLDPFIDKRKPTEGKRKLEMALQLMARCRVLVLCGDIITTEMVCAVDKARQWNMVYTNLQGIKKIDELLKGRK